MYFFKKFIIRDIHIVENFLKTLVTTDYQGPNRQPQAINHLTFKGLTTVAVGATVDIPLKVLELHHLPKDLTTWMGSTTVDIPLKVLGLHRLSKALTTWMGSTTVGRTWKVLELHRPLMVCYHVNGATTAAGLRGPSGD